MMKLNSSLLDEIKVINWFSQVGNELLEVKNSCIQVNNWNECEAYFLNPDWEDTTLEASNTLTSFLSRKNPNAYSEWNRLTKEGQKFFKAFVIPKIDALHVPVQDLEVLKACVRWDLLGCLMESAYEKYHPPKFFTQLLDVYKQGHFPCGWQGAWPEGKLIIY